MNKIKQILLIACVVALSTACAKIESGYVEPGPVDGVGAFSVQGRAINGVTVDDGTIFRISLFTSGAHTATANYAYFNTYSRLVPAAVKGDGTYDAANTNSATPGLAVPQLETGNGGVSYSMLLVSPYKVFNTGGAGDPYLIQGREEALYVSAEPQTVTVDKTTAGNLVNYRFNNGQAISFAKALVDNRAKIGFTVQTGDDLVGTPLELTSAEYDNVGKTAYIYKPAHDVVVQYTGNAADDNVQSVAVNSAENKSQTNGTFIFAADYTDTSLKSLDFKIGLKLDGTDMDPIVASVRHNIEPMKTYQFNFTIKAAVVEITVTVTPWEEVDNDGETVGIGTIDLTQAWREALNEYAVGETQPLEPGGWGENNTGENVGESPAGKPDNWVDNPSGGDLGNQEGPAWNENNNGHIVG